MASEVDRNGALRLLGAIVLGVATSWVILKGGFFILREVWPAYALANPDRAYTLPMLLVRLGVFAVMISATSAVAAWVVEDSRMALLAGVAILAVSIPLHLYPGYVWDDYPAWYHIVYLLSILPNAFLTARCVGNKFGSGLSPVESGA